MNPLGALGNIISGVGTALNLPDFGIGSALGGSQTLPGAIQGVDPSTYQGVGVVNTASSPLQPVQNFTPTGTTTTTRGGTTSTGGGSTTPTTTDLYNQLMGKGNDLVSQLHSLYNQIYGAVDQAGAAQRANLEQAHQADFNNLSNQYGLNMRGIAGNALARGISGSSYEGQDNQDAYNNYLSGSNSIKNAQDADLAKLGGWVNSQKAQYQTQDQLLNNNPLSGYQNDASGVYGLQNYINNSLNQNLLGARTALAGMGDQASQIAAANAVAPATTDASGVQSLQKQLSDLTNSSLPGAVKDQIAQAHINTASDPGAINYLKQYYANLNPNAPIIG